jgi:cytochrome c oxidase cbb3-type subunit 3
MPLKARWIAIASAGVLALLAGAAGARRVWTQAGYADLLRVDADAILTRPDLSAFAMARAAPIYQRECAGCHGVDLAGNRRLGAPDLADADWLHGEGRVSQIEQTLTHGVRSGDPKGRNLASMPAYGQPKPYQRYHIPPLSPPDIGDVTEYLLTLEGRPADPAAAGRGDAIFHGRGGCYDCHGPDGRGDGAIGAPNLADTIWLYGDGSRAAIFRSVAGGRAGACPAWIQRLSAGEIRALAVFVHAHGGVAARPAWPRT